MGVDLGVFPRRSSRGHPSCCGFQPIQQEPLFPLAFFSLDPWRQDRQPLQLVVCSSPTDAVGLFQRLHELALRECFFFNGLQGLDNEVPEFGSALSPVYFEQPRRPPSEMKSLAALHQSSTPTAS